MGKKIIDEDFLYVTELYRDALKGMITNPSAANDHATLSPLITNVEFKIVKEVLPELEEAYMTTNPASLGHMLCLSLFTSLASRKTSKENFVFVFENSSVTTVANIVANPYLPLEMLLDNDIYESFRGDKFFDYLVDTRIHAIRGRRYWEVVSYLKTIDPDVENMSAEMVLSVLGIK